jgi:hypothetical protein
MQKGVGKNLDKEYFQNVPNSMLSASRLRALLIKHYYNLYLDLENQNIQGECCVCVDDPMGE